MTTRTTRFEREAILERRLALATRLMGGAVAVLAVVLVAALVGRDPAPQVASVDLPNPMGGPTLAAPAAGGAAADLGGLEVGATDVQLGDVPLDVTVVSQWRITNPTGEALPFVVGQPQVLEGCCPGPVHVDGDEVAPGGTVTVPAGEAVTVQFPLQMHAGMDGPHHLTVPLQAGEVATSLHVTGNFTSTASI